MRAFLLIGLGFLSAAVCVSETGNAAVTQAPAAVAQAPAAAAQAPAADPAKPAVDCGKPAAASEPPTLTAKQVQTVLCCIDSSLNANLAVKINFMKVLAQTKDVFDKDFWPAGTVVPLKTATHWTKVGEPIAKALKDTPPATTGFAPGFALRANVPVGSKCQCLPGQYVLLLSCTTKAGQLYFNEQLVGWFWIDDITTTLNAVFPPPATASNSG
jgi:hypothetical protein